MPDVIQEKLLGIVDMETITYQTSLQWKKLKMKMDKSNDTQTVTSYHQISKLPSMQQQHHWQRRSQIWNPGTM